MRLGLLMIVLCFGWTAQAMAALQRPTPQFSVDQGERITVRSQNGKTFFELQERQWFDKEGKPLFFGKLSNPMEMEDKVQIDLDGGGTSSHVIVDLCESDLNYIRRVEEAASRVQGGGKREADRSSVAGRFHSRAGRMEKWWEIERKMKEFPVSELHNERAAPFKFVQEHKTGVKDWTPKELPEVQIPFVEDEIDEFFLESRITISQDGRLAAVGMGDTTAGKVKIFDLKTEKLLFELETFNGPRPLSFSSDNQMLAIGYENPMSPVQIWKLSSDGFEYLYGFRLFVQGGTNYGTFLDNETLAFTGFANVNVVDLANGRVLASAPAKDCNTNGGPAYLLAEERETPFVLDMQAGTAKRLDTEMVAFDSNMSITADGRLAAFNDHFQRRVWVHDLKSDKRLVEIRLVQNFPRPTQFLTNRWL